MENTKVRQTIRFPPDLHRHIQARANINSRSFNAEVMHRLEAGKRVDLLEEKHFPQNRSTAIQLARP